MSALTRLEDVIMHTNRVLCILGQNPGKFTLQGTNTYIVGTGKLRTLIDTGEGKWEYKKLLFKMMEERNIEGFDQILCTHHHYDHIGGLPDVLEKLEGRVFKRGWSKEDTLTINSRTNQEVKFKVNDIVDGQLFKTEGATLRAIFTPGHSKDHFGFWLEEENSYFSGDCILGEGTTVFENLQDYMDSLFKISRLEGLSVIYPGHGRLIKDGLDWVNHYIAHRKKREMEILDCLSASEYPLQVSDIRAVVYKDTPERLWRAAEGNVTNTLSMLLLQKKVEKVGSTWSIMEKALVENRLPRITRSMY